MQLPILKLLLKHRASAASSNHRIVGVGRDLKRSSSTTPLWSENLCFGWCLKDEMRKNTKL